MLRINQLKLFLFVAGVALPHLVSLDDVVGRRTGDDSDTYPDAGGCANFSQHAGSNSYAKPTSGNASTASHRPAAANQYGYGPSH